MRGVSWSRHPPAHTRKRCILRSPVASRSTVVTLVPDHVEGFFLCAVVRRCSARCSTSPSARPPRMPCARRDVRASDDRRGAHRARRPLAACESGAERYRVLVAANGAEVLLRISRHRDMIDLVLTDVVMPVMGGRELVERLTAIGSRAPVLFMSGYTDSERGGNVRRVPRCSTSRSRPGHCWSASARYSPGERLSDASFGRARDVRDMMGHAPSGGSGRTSSTRVTSR